MATFLTINGVQNVYKSAMPDEPNEAVCLYEYGGAGPHLTHTGIGYRNPALQAVVRAMDYQTARSRIETIYLLIASLSNDQLGGTMVLDATPNQEPFPLGPVDSQGRIRLVCNFNLSTGG